MVNYFFDSYAVIELIKANPKYIRFSDNVVTITIFNLVEIYWSVLNDYGVVKADEIFSIFDACVVDIDPETIKQAMKFRKQNKKMGLSYADCIGYVYSLNHNLVFLTGDKEFEKLSNVEFVKK